jgi:triphosphoribosyl-dephospho-CoA synthase
MTLMAASTSDMVSPSAPLDMQPATRIAQLARQALIAEAELTPKPGLVDRRGPGAHRDLTLATMRLSAWTIEPYFLAMACRCIAKRPSQNLREQLAVIGRNAERAMLTATGGSNTHKGAIWILGLLVSSAAMHAEEAITARELAATAQQIARFEDRAAPIFLSHGDLVAAKYGVTGARGEAVSGFPKIVEVGLPTLRDGRARSLNEVEARLDTLLAIISRLEDTCLLYRGGRLALRAAQHGAIAVLNAGGSATLAGMQQLKTMERTLLDLGVSPGGSADLLAATLFMDALERNCESVQPDHSEEEGIDGTP